MKMCVTATAGNLDAQADPRFGRCQYFVIVDPDTMKFEAITNESIMASGGAGIQAAQTIANKGVELVITGNVGPNAFQTLTAAGIKIATGAYGTVRDAIEMYKSGRLSETGGATVAEHAGMGGMGMSSGNVAGGGRGMGRGGGRGMGLGMQQIPPQVQPTITPQTKEQEIEMLSKQIGALEKELKEVKNILKELKR